MMMIRYDNNNPFNIRCVPRHYKGEIGHKDGVVCFSNLKFGIRAALFYLMVYCRSKNISTYSGLLGRLSELCFLDSNSVIGSVCEKLHKFPWDVLETPSQYCALLSWFWFCMDGNVYPTRWLVDVVYEFPELKRLL